MSFAEKIPGYCGHIPYKGDYYGLTTGNLNRVAQGVHNTRNGFSTAASQVLASSKSAMSLQRSTMVDPSILKPEKQLMVSNFSKNSKSWINGPAHEIRSQCIPGYTGYIQGV